MYRDIDTARYSMIKAAEESQLMGIAAYKEYEPLQDELYVFFDLINKKTKNVTI